MDIGFETIGNATLIIHDSHPLLVTDPWITGSAYFQRMLKGKDHVIILNSRKRNRGITFEAPRNSFTSGCLGAA